MSRAPAIGIDLGTSHCCVGVFRDGQVEIIPNDQGQRTTPSLVAFTDTHRLVGPAAKTQAARNPENTLFDVKRLLGRRFWDSNLQKDMTHWPFKVVNDGGKPKVQVDHEGRTKRLTAEEVSAMLLARMRQAAEAYLGQEVRDAVISVPACSTLAQRQATRDAGTIAGLNVLRVISEPTAAAMAYGLQTIPRPTGGKHVLTFDLGCSTAGVSVVTIYPSEAQGAFFEAKAMAVYTDLQNGFDRRLVNHFVQEFKRKHRLDISNNPRALQRLRTACEEAKRTLSSSAEASVRIDSLHEGIDFYTRITRARFEKLCADLFRDCLKPVEKALRDAKMDKKQIHEVVLVGGSTRIPKIQKMLQEFFDGKELNRSIHPDEAVAYGAAVQAAVVMEDPSDVIQGGLLVDVLSMSLGIETAGGVMTTVIPRNTRFPSQAVHSLGVVTRRTDTRQDRDRREDTDTVVGVLRSVLSGVLHSVPSPSRNRPHLPALAPLATNPAVVPIRVFEGERAKTTDNTLLAEFHPTGIRPDAGSGIQVTFAINVNGILSVAAKNTTTGATQSITIRSPDGLSEGDIRRMTREAQQHREDDLRHLYDLRTWVLARTRALSEADVTLSGEDHRAVRALCRHTLRWVQANHQARQEDVDRKRRKVERILAHLGLSAE